MLKNIYKRKIFATAARLRGAGPSPGDLAYKDIEPLSPDLFAQLRFAKYNGVQVLFQDAACTDPVTEPGNHVIGGVKDPFTGEIILTQTDAAKKPLWMGPGVGAYFDGIDDYLIGTNPLDPSVRTVISAAEADVVHRGCIVGTRIDAAKGFETRVDSNDRVSTFQSTNTESLRIGTYVNNASFVVSTRYEEGVGHWGRISNQSSATNPDIGPTSASPSITIGSLEYVGNPRDPFEGTITETLAFSRALTEPDITTVEQTLEALQ